MHKFSSLKQIVLFMIAFLCLVILAAGVSALADISPGNAVNLKGPTSLNG